MKRHRSNKPDDSGAILIYAVFAVIGLVAFTTLVVDYGVFWTARRQAQNVADAAAMAGAVALAYEGPVDWTSAGAAVNSALATAQSNLIWGEAPGSGIVATDITFAKSPSSCVITDCAACPVRVYTCVRAEVFRNAARNNPLPSFFGVLIGINSQEMKATATARSAPANASACVRPFVVPDRYSEVSGDPNLFDGGDIYNSYGYLFANTFGQLSGAMPVLTKYSTTYVSAGAFRFLNETGSPLTAPVDVQHAIRACPTTLYRVTDDLTAKIVADPTFEPVFLAAVKNGIDDLVALDPGADWDGQRIAGSCVLTHTCKQYDATGDGLIDAPTATISPRVIVVPIFDPSKAGQTTIVNFLAFFVQRFNLVTGEVEGVLVGHPGVVDASVHGMPADVSFLRFIELVR